MYKYILVAALTSLLLIGALTKSQYLVLMKTIDTEAAAQIMDAMK